MAKALTDKIYSDRILKCVCNKFIGRVVMDAQVLILESGLIIYNCLFWKCDKCDKNGSFLAPTLPNESPTLDNLIPDTKQLERRAGKLKGITRLAFDRYRVRIKDKYIGVYPDEAAAVKVRDATVLEQKAKDLGYKMKSRQTDDDEQNNTHTSAVV